ncbi:hypothetical protein ACROYT_G030745 [Oculina patagonica]
MAVQAPHMLRGLVSPLQLIAALIMFITGIFDRLRRIFVPSYIVMPVWTGVLILITATVGVSVGTKLNLGSNSRVVITYRALNVFCSILCGFILFWYGAALSVYGWFADQGKLKNLNELDKQVMYGQLEQLKKELVEQENESFAVVAIIFTMALVEVLLSIMAILASQERNSSYMQFEDSPMAPYDNRTMHVPLNRVEGSNFATHGVIQEATAYQPVPHAILQAGAPVMMAPAYLNQMGSTKASVMLVPAENLQQMPGTSGGGLMYVQVPANQILAGSTQENTTSKVTQATIHTSGPQSPEEVQGII